MGATCKLKLIAPVICVVLLPLYYVIVRNTQQDVVHVPAPKSWDARSLSNAADPNGTNFVADSFDNAGMDGIPTRTERISTTTKTISATTETISVANGTTPRATRTGKSCSVQVQIWKRFKDYVKPRDYYCPKLECKFRYVADKSFDEMKKTDALIFHHIVRWDWDVMLKNRPAGQKWIFFTRESPMHTLGRAMPPAKYRNNTYDYTMNFARQSDIPNPYGYYDAHKPQVSGAQDWARHKTRHIAWMASNCDRPAWNRLDFVKALSKRIKVNMYGKCGTKQCAKNNEKCDELLESHKFYLALENCECRDYITEKFWRSLQLNLVPLVYGAPKEDYARVAPPNSFIHLQDFTSFTELIDYIQLVDANDTLYNSFLEWKQIGSVGYYNLGDNVKPQFMCNVVSKILEDRKLELSGVKPPSSFADIDSWWTNACRKGKGFPHDFS